MYSVSRTVPLSLYRIAFAPLFSRSCRLSYRKMFNLIRARDDVRSNKILRERRSTAFYRRLYQLLGRTRNSLPFSRLPFTSSPSVGSENLVRLHETVAESYNLVTSGELGKIQGKFRQVIPNDGQSIFVSVKELGKSYKISGIVIRNHRTRGETNFSVLFRFRKLHRSVFN